MAALTPVSAPDQWRGGEMEVTSPPGQYVGVLGAHGRLFGMGGRCQEGVGGAKKNPG
ncbi:hypothetical protein [Aeromonas allosaccharophila]|uniref:Uncharacterized protein n=1 Tax=Aeromonas allosaccharophila TaxID=656 RepID=A0AAX3NTC8_9GAMM|nr:hypothetical protein [Aeromonas allosaccharophila]WED76865.1 hypothetical protein PYU98_00820 [Aeromonas allosaccharophila]